MADALGLEPGVVRYIEYDARWPALFAAERQRLRDRCGTLTLTLERYMNAKSPHVEEILRLASSA
jgi:GrpB-like predicted nucleotidyltransferase (UPF0157 family)